MWIDDVLILLPKLRPQAGVVQNDPGNLGERLAGSHHMHFEFFGVWWLLIRAKVPVRQLSQIFRRRPLLRRGPGWRLRLRQNG